MRGQGVRFMAVALVAGAGMAACAAEVVPEFKTLRADDSQATKQADLYYTHLGLTEVSDLAVGGQVRVRGEYWNNFAGVPANDDEFLLTRLRLHADLRTCQYFRLYAEGISAFANGRDLPTPDKSGKRPIDEDELDLQNAFIDLAPLGRDALTVRVGRQEMAYGRERTLGVLDWVNTRRTFDAVRVLTKVGDWKVDAFAAQLVQVQRYEFNDGDSGQEMYGAYAAGKGATVGVDVYGLRRNKDGVAGKPDDERNTLGSRLAGDVGDSGLDYDVEGGYQFGDQGDADIRAWSVASQVGYKIPGCPLKSRVFAGYDYATGDGDAKDGKVTRYDQLYPTGHAFFGLIDLIGRQNIQDYSVGIGAKPLAKIKVNVEGHLFQRVETADAVFDAGGNQIIAGDASAERNIGQELDVTVGWQANPHLLLAAGYGHLFAGAVLKDAKREDIDTAYLSGQYSF